MRDKTVQFFAKRDKTVVSLIKLSSYRTPFFKISIILKNGFPYRRGDLKVLRKAETSTTIILVTLITSRLIITSGSSLQSVKTCSVVSMRIRIWHGDNIRGTHLALIFVISEYSSRILKIVVSEIPPDFVSLVDIAWTSDPIIESCGTPWAITASSHVRLSRFS